MDAIRNSADHLAHHLLLSAAWSCFVMIEKFEI